jgi:hypothetical protein
MEEIMVHSSGYSSIYLEIIMKYELMHGKKSNYEIFRIRRRSTGRYKARFGDK